MQAHKIYQKAFDTWGVHAQINVAIEECAELIVALQHLKRKRINREDIITEIADVEIMVEQLKIIFGAEAVNMEKCHKLKRLESNINNTQRNRA